LLTHVVVVPPDEESADYSSKKCGKGVGCVEDLFEEALGSLVDKHKLAQV